MDPQQLLIAGITAVTGALTVIARLLWTKVSQCETDRADLRKEHHELRVEYLTYVKDHTEHLTQVIMQNTIALGLNTTALQNVVTNPQTK